MKLEGVTALIGLIVVAFVIMAGAWLVVRRQLNVKIGPIAVNAQQAADSAVTASKAAEGTYLAVNGVDTENGEARLIDQVRLIGKTQRDHIVEQAAWRDEIRGTLSDVTATLVHHGAAIEANAETLRQHAQAEETFGSSIVARLGSLETVVTNIAGRVTDIEDVPSPPKPTRKATT